MNIPLADLWPSHSGIREELLSVFEKVLNSSRFILGPEVEALEREIADYMEVQHAIGVASCTDALYIALVAAGVGPGDEVITTPFSFVASSECIARCGATPVFVDIDPKTYNIDPARIRERITSKTAAILPVHLYGRPAEMAAIMEVAEHNGLKVIEDCAQAFGARYNGKHVGTFGVAGCLSFFPSKILGALGDGGMVVTSDAEVAKKCRIIRTHGGKSKYRCQMHGLNSRLDALQAAVLRVKLKHIDGWIDQRISTAEEYKRTLASLPIELPAASSNAKHVFNYYTIRVPERRDELQQYLKEKGIGCAVYYPLSLHLQEVYSCLGYGEGDFPNSERAQREALSLPMYPGMTAEDVERVAGMIQDFYEAK